MHEAAVAISEGKRVRRKAWPPAWWLRRARNWEAYVKDGRGYLGLVEFMQFEGRAYSDWGPDLADLCAEDWEVVL